MRHVIALGIAVMLAACAIPQGGMVKRGAGGGLFANLGKPLVQETGSFVDEMLDVVTEPAGARVQINDAFMGYAPVRASVRRYWRGNPGNMTLDQVKIEALPEADGQCVQGGLFGEASRKVPSPVRFNMGMCSAAAPANTAPTGRRR